MIVPVDTVTNYFITHTISPSYSSWWVVYTRGRSGITQPVGY